MVGVNIDGGEEFEEVCFNETRGLAASCRSLCALLDYPEGLQSVELRIESQGSQGC